MRPPIAPIPMNPSSAITPSVPLCSQRPRGRIVRPAPLCCHTCLAECPRVPVLPNLQMRWRLALVALYLAVILPLLLVNNVGLTPDSLVFIFFGAALLIGRPILF